MNDLTTSMLRNLDMKKYLTAFILMNAILTSPLQAQPAFTGTDYSGIYECKGDDTKEGAYKGVVTMKLKPEHSFATYASYDFKLEVPGYGTYLGEAAANGNQFAMHFALTDPATKDFGTGVATIKKNKQGKFAFHKFYYEPEFKGGNTGTEDCVIK